MRAKNISVILNIFLGISCISAIYVPGDNLNKVSGVKTTKLVQIHHNYSNVYPQKLKTLYIASESSDGTSQKLYPVYNGDTYGQRPGVPENVQKMQKVQVYNRLNNTREENIRNLQDTLEKLEQPNQKLVPSIKRKKEIVKEIEVYSKCPSGVTGQFVYDLSCNQYLNCWKGRGIVQNCSPGTLFNPKILQCDFPEKVECLTGPRQNTIKIRRGTTHSTEQAKCPENFVGMIPNYQDCSKFINCNNGHQTPMDCPPGTLFDITKNMCDHTHLCICYNGQNVQEKVQGGGTKSQKSQGVSTQNQNYGQHHGIYQTTYDQNQNNGIDDKIDFGASRQYQQVYHQGSNFDSNQQRPGATYYQGSSINSNQPGSGTNYHQSYSFSSNQQRPGTSYNQGSSLASNQQSYGTSNQDISFNSNQQRPNSVYNQGATLYSNQQRPGATYNQDSTFNLNQPGSGTSYYQGASFTSNQQGSATSNQDTTYNSNQQRPNSVYNQGTTIYSNQQRPGTTYSQGTTINSNQHSSGATYNQNPTLNSNHQQSGVPSSGINYYTGILSCPESNGIFKHPTDCKKFINCANNSPFVQDCAPGTLFNPVLGNCDFPYNVNCNVGNTDNAVEGAGTESYVERNDRQGHKINSWNQQINPNLDWGTNDGAVVNIGYGTQRPVHTTYRTNLVSQSYQRPKDYDDMFNLNYKPRTTTSRSLIPKFPDPVPTTDVNADYHFDNEDYYDVLEIGEVYDHKPKKETICQTNDFHCTPRTCVAKTSICDGRNDCANGKDELNCEEYLFKFQKHPNSKLAVVEKQRWNNVNYTTCAKLCLDNTKIDCKSFNYRKVDRTCFLSESNIGLSGMLMHYEVCDYYELKSQTLDCRKLHKCANNKCISFAQICDGFDDCGDRMDEKNCPAKNLGYSVRLKGGDKSHKGRIEVTVFNKTGFVCDDRFGLNEASVVCRELGFELGASEVKINSFFAQDIVQNNTFYMMDDVNCLGNETSIKDCDFSGWGVHNCLNGEIAGVICKIPQEKCPSDSWQCYSGSECIPYGFVCDGLYDCSDNSDEDQKHCDAPLELRLVGPSENQGRVEVKHHGLWGTICDDDFNEDAAKVVCKQLGFRGSSIVKKEAYFGVGSGPIWLDQVYCYGNETNLENCSHWNWGEHNCDHSEDVGVICSNIDIVEKKSREKIPEYTVSQPILPASCGLRKDSIFIYNDDVHFRVVKGSIAKPGDYPWQAVIRIKTKSGRPKHWCGAVVISSKFLLTAAHCLTGYSKGAYLIVAGDYNVDEVEGTEQTDFIEDFFLHEEFRQGHKMNNDIAIIKLKKGFTLNQDVQALCLPDEHTTYGANMNCTVSGFGLTESGGDSFSHNMMAGWVPIPDEEVCKMPHVYGDNIKEGMFCAGSIEEGVDTCDGDSGGPLACLKDGYFTLYGITSFGQRCGLANKPGVYVKVAHYRKWIDNILEKHA